MTPSKIPHSRWGASTSVATKVTIEITPSYHCAVYAWINPLILTNPTTAIMIMAASTDCGRWYKSDVKNIRTTTTVRLVNTLDRLEFAPDCRLTADREKDPEVG